MPRRSFAPEEGTDRDRATPRKRQLQADADGVAFVEICAHPGGRGGGRDNHDDGDEPQGSLQNVVARTGTQRLNLAPSTGESVRVRTPLAGGGGSLERTRLRSRIPC